VDYGPKELFIFIIPGTWNVDMEFRYENYSYVGVGAVAVEVLVACVPRLMAS
jgi:hypothetical protein